jgi:hypothetical protein
VTFPAVDLPSVCAFITLAMIQGALVALPRPVALGPLTRLRSPLWALAAPGSLLFGTFGVLAMPSLATGLAILAGVATPVLAVIAVVAVVHRGRWALVMVPVALGVVALVGTGVAAELGASLLTALGCLTLGAAIVRLTPVRWLQLGVVAMAVVDVVLLATGIGQPAATLLDHALNGGGPTFHRVELGSMSTDYPDLVLAAVLGGVVSGRAIQPRAGALVALLATLNGALFMLGDIVPATGPLVLALLLVEWRPRLRPRLRVRLQPGFWARLTHLPAPIAWPQEA